MIKKLLLLLLACVSSGTPFFGKRQLYGIPYNVTIDKTKPTIKNDMIMFFKIWATMFIFLYPFIEFPVDKKIN